MASTSAALLCAMTGLVLWTVVGYAIALRLPLPAHLQRALTPVLGWAVQTSLSLALSLLAGFSWLSILASVAIAMVVFLRAPSYPDSELPVPLSGWIFVGAGLVALLPAAAILPKVVAGGILLSDPMFDHSKIALIDQMVREGLPPANPVMGGLPHSGIAYYYLWHFGAAELARLTGSSGWEADAASTWFTAYACLCLMGGIATHLARHTVAAAFVLVACLAASVRPVLWWLFGEERVDQIITPASGLRGWLFQTTWSPHHMASASCTVLAAIILVRLSSRRSVLAAAVLILLFAAAFESSLWVGGVVLPLAICVIAPTLTMSAAADHRRWFLTAVVGAGLLAALLCAPLLTEQFRAASMRGGGLPIALAPPETLGARFPDPLRRRLDLIAYWMILLVIEFPVILVTGCFGLWHRLHEKMHSPADLQTDALALTLLAAVSLCCGWLLVSTAGLNNDLGWRAVLPGVLVLTAAAGAGFTRWLSQQANWAVAAVLASVAAAAPESVNLVASEWTGTPSPSAAQFLQAPQLWQAVRRHTPAAWRVASNPMLFADMTPWPVNISWALLANRRSCYAGEELAIAFAPISAEARAQSTARFVRVFQGQAEKDDLAELLRTYDCRVVVVTVQDGAWKQDPFATSAFYSLVESRPDQWRIYVSSHPETQRFAP